MSEAALYRTNRTWIVAILILAAGWWLEPCGAQVGTTDLKRIEVRATPVQQVICRFES